MLMDYTRDISFSETNKVLKLMLENKCFGCVMHMVSTICYISALSPLATFVAQVPIITLV